ncbi:hypothetical protein [Anaerobiospirillum succiniciproducens]|uniref:hypothetical protein n=1 Tax=Anaerobiospirillum succiniciproducens TaxID=13335 RepID=UPI003F8A1A82
MALHNLGSYLNALAVRSSCAYIALAELFVQVLCLVIWLAFVSCLQTKTPEANMVVGIWRLSLALQQANKATILYLLVMDCKFAAALVGVIWF